MKTQTKLCTKCGKEKTLNEFWKSSSSKDGFRSSCIECTKSMRICNKIKKNRSSCKIEIDKRKKICPKCGKEKCFHSFGNNKSKKDGKSSLCKMCHNEIRDKWKKNNIKKRRQYEKEYSRRNKDKINRRKKYYKLINKDKDKKYYLYQIQNITDVYVRGNISKRTGLSKKDINLCPEIMNHFRQKLKLKRRKKNESIKTD